MKLALPKGRLLSRTSAFLQRAGLEISGYDGHSRSYRPQCANFPDLSIKMFHEKDVPIQVAVGNYDLGICGLDWIEELLSKYPSSALVKMRDLGYENRELVMACAQSARICSIEELKATKKVVRIATEYPNLAESFALNQRLRRFNIFPLWGAAEVYPPESADLALICVEPADNPDDHGLRSLANVLHSRAFLIAYQPSWESKDMSSLLHHLYNTGGFFGK